MRQTHQNGGYGSTGYGYDWKVAEAEKNLLRTHTTAVSSRMLYKLAQVRECARARCPPAGRGGFDLSLCVFSSIKNGDGPCADEAQLLMLRCWCRRRPRFRSIAGRLPPSQVLFDRPRLPE